jgi:hypothetical protein
MSFVLLNFYIFIFLHFSFSFFFLSALHCLFFICGFGLQHWYPPNFLSFSNDSNIYQAIKSFTTKFQANLIMTTHLSGIFFICSFYFVIYYDIISRFFSCISFVIGLRFHLCNRAIMTKVYRKVLISLKFTCLFYLCHQLL